MILETDATRRTERRDSEEVEIVTERFDTAGHLLSRMTERRDNRSRTMQDETFYSHSVDQSDSLGAIRAELDGKSLEEVESEIESEIIQEEEVVPGKGLAWWQKTLMYCGGIALLGVILWLFKPRLSGVLTAIKNLLNSN